MSYAYPPGEQALVARIVRQPAFKRLLDLPLLAWQEIALVLGCYAVLLGGSALYLGGELPYPVVAIASALAIYAIFTPLHDATHRSVSRNSFVNDLVGTLAAQPMVPGASVSLYRYLHLEHHRHTGDPERDPDEALVSAGPLGRVLIASFIELKWMHWYMQHLAQRSRGERVRDLGSLVLYMLWHAAWLFSPHAIEFVLLWMVPQRLGLLLVAYLFAAIQHPEGVLEHEHPFQATRMFRGGDLLRILMLSQSQHLMHHLFPMLPYYRYNAAWKLSEDELREQDLVWDTPIGKLVQPELRPVADRELLSVRIEQIEDLTAEVRAYTLAAADGMPLPAYDAGAHVDVHIAPGIVRQYSLTSLAGSGRYSIAVKREAGGRGGSRLLHEQFREGQTIRIGRPRNLFALQPGDRHAVLVAGGIGITPILGMAQELHRRGTGFEFHACARDHDVLPFADRLRTLPWSERVHTWVDSEGGLQAAAIPAYQAGYSLYLCGPTGFMEYVGKLAAQQGWPAAAIHREAFQAASSESNRPFTVELARSGRTIEVAADMTLLDALQQHQVRIAASCVQGLCGTCKCRVVEGAVDHRDQFFSADERAAGMMTPCVSRAAGDSRLVIDL